MWQHSQRPPAQFILRIQLKCHGGSRETTCAVGTASRKRWRIDRDLFYFDLPPQQILKDTSGEHDAINAGSCGARGGPLARVLESVTQFWLFFVLLCFGWDAISHHRVFKQQKTKRRLCFKTASENKQAGNIFKHKWIKKKNSANDWINQRKPLFLCGCSADAVATFARFQKLPHN